MTANPREIVLEKWPKAFCSLTIGMRIGIFVPNQLRRAINTASTEAEAWARAAERLQKEAENA